MKTEGDEGDPTLCHAEGCSRRAQSRGFCAAHYNSAKRGGLLLSRKGTKVPVFEQMKAEQLPERCLFCDGPLSGRQTICCGDPECRRTYGTCYRSGYRADLEARA